MPPPGRLLDPIRDIRAHPAQTLPRRRFGRTEQQVPILGLGTAPAGTGLPDPWAIALYHACLDHGVTYFDTAPAYHRAHRQLAEVLATRRSEVFLVTKADAAAARELVAMHEESLRELRTERVDVLFAHNVGRLNLEEMLAPDGVFAGLRELKRRGLTRFIGFSSHHRPATSEALLADALAGGLELDAVMLAMNYVDRHTYGFERRALPLARRLDLGVACMKVFGGAREMDYASQRISALGDRPHLPALRYALGLPGVAVAVVGMTDPAQLQHNIEWAVGWEPLSTEEEAALERDGRALAAEWGPHFG